MRRFALLALLALTALPGCLSLGTPSRPTTFYLLSSLVSEDPEALAQASPDGAVIGVGPVEVPAHLNRPQIVMRAEDNRLQLAEFHKWGEPLRDSIARSLSENLAVLLETQRVLVYPWPIRTPLDHRVRLDILRFSAGPDPNVTLRSRWSLYDGDGKLVAARGSQLREPTDLSDYDAVVEAMSRAVGTLARELAVAIREAPEAPQAGSPAR